jgi:hypothetical protein
MADRRGRHDHASPAPAGPAEHAPHEPEAGTLTGEPSVTFTLRLVSLKVCSMKLECRMRAWWPAEKRR